MSSSTSKRPRYEHDCDRCVYLGHADFALDPYDAYVCPQSGWPTVILRYGDDGEDYHSGQHLVDRLPGPMSDKAAELMAQWRAAG